MKRYIPFFLLLNLLTNVFSQKSLLQLENDSIEDVMDRDIGRFNRDNKVYQSYREFVFDYVIVKNGDSLQCRFSKQEYGVPNWQLIKPQNADSFTANTISILVLPYYLNDNQTGMRYHFYNKKGQMITQEATGLIENNKNVWLHPMRTQFFEITEFNSFPYIKAPYQIGMKWQSGLGIGYFASYERFNLKWEGVLDSKEDLEIIDKVKLPTALGELDCYVVQGVCKTRLTESKTLFYFNETYGFVKIVYDLFDKSRLELNLKEVKNKVKIPKSPFDN